MAAISAVERAIELEARLVLGQPKFSYIKQVMEWRTSSIVARDGEKLAFLPKMCVHIAYLEAKPKSANRKK